MKRVFVLAVFSLFVNLAACQSSGSKAIVTMQPAEFNKKLVVTGVQLLDVRSAQEYADGHLAGSINIDVNSDNFSAEVAKLDKSKPVMVYCHSGRRSASAAGKMEQLGFKEIYNLDGGITSWLSEERPVTKK